MIDGMRFLKEIGGAILHKIYTEIARTHTYAPPHTYQRTQEPMKERPPLGKNKPKSRRQQLRHSDKQDPHTYPPMHTQAYPLKNSNTHRQAHNHTHNHNQSDRHTDRCTHNTSSHTYILLSPHFILH